MQLRQALEYRLGCVGVGHMASVILRAVLAQGLVPPQNLTVFDIDPARTNEFGARGARVADSAAEAARNSDVLLLAVRPLQMEELTASLAPLCAGKCLVSIAAGIPTGFIRARVPGAFVVRVMPNMAMTTGRGAAAVAEAPEVPRGFFDAACALFQAGGITEVLPEQAMDAVIAVNGSSPAFFYRVAAVMMEYAAAEGIDPAAALRLAAKTMEGAAAVLLEGAQKPAELVRIVQTAGGTTEAAMRRMDELDFDRALREGMEACTRRARELSTGRA